MKFEKLMNRVLTEASRDYLEKVDKSYTPMMLIQGDFLYVVLTKKNRGYAK
jgi:hypothetical protein